MIRKIIKIVFILLIFVVFPQLVFSQQNSGNDDGQLSLHDEDYFARNSASYKEHYIKGKIVKIEEERPEEVYDGYVEKRRVVSIEIEGGEIIKVDDVVLEEFKEGREFKVGDNVVVLVHESRDGGKSYYIYDYNRINGLIFITVIFLVIIVYFGRRRGVGSLLGLIFSILILLYYIIPGIIEGKDPVLTTLFGSIFIASISLFLSHGVNKRTPIIWLSTVTTLVLAVFLSHFFIEVTRLFGMGSDATLAFQMGEYAHINLRGLLLAGVVISVLGILDDVTATQTAVIWELRKSNKELQFKELYKRSLNVGREHIASLVSTLALVYIGASLPLFILIKGIDYMPLWVKINEEFIAEEIARTIIGSSALILAVPIASVFAAYFISRVKNIK